MKKLVNVVEVDGEGLTALLGEMIEVWCLNYIYFGTLAGVNKEDILLEDAYIVYETGVLNGAKYRDAQPLPTPRYIRISAIESYAVRQVTL